MARRHLQPLRSHSSGAALLIFLILLVTAALTYVVTNLTPEMVEARRAQKTSDALAQARTALLWYAETFRDQQNKIQIDAGNPPPNYVNGYLPLPDLGSSTNTNIGCAVEGCDANLSGSALNKTVIGRLPWYVLGIEPLRDGHGECLWYAVSGGHQRVEKAVPMNWDTLGQIDIVTTNETNPDKLKILLASPHERPTAIVFSPGPPLAGQNRGALGSDDVRVCGGNYNPANYLDPNVAAALLDSAGNATSASAYFNGNVSTNTGTTRLAVTAQGKIYRDGTALRTACPPNSSNCPLAANDVGLPITPDSLFGEIRKNAYFRQDINALLDRIVGCLRDEIAAGGGPTGYGKIAGATNNTCYGASIPPAGYYPHYQELIFVARGTMSVNGQSCAGAALFANQRGAGQVRASATDKNDPINYLEGINYTGFHSGSGTVFSGPELFERTSVTELASQDIVRCIPATSSYVTVGPTIAGLGQLASYSAATRILTLGQPVSATLPATAAQQLYGCAWTPETHAMGSGLRSYFMFRINDAGFSSAATEGLAFAIVDGDNNGPDACGAAAQHMGYSGNNQITPFIVPPKIAFEIDPRRESGFNPNASNTFTNGRNDPSYAGGHVGIVYWGGDTAIPTTAIPPCILPRINVGGVCYLPQEQDDNIHGQTANTRTGFPAPPANPAAPATPLSVPPDAPAGVYKLDPNLSQVPVNRDFHVRVELTRTASQSAVSAARVATSGNLDLANPGSAIDGIVLFAGDRVLAKDQAVAAENGLYVWNGATSPLTRATDADTAQELTNSVVEIAQGTLNARTLWRQSTTALVPGSDAIRWTNLSVKVSIAQASINLTSPGTMIDSIFMKLGDRVLVKNLGVYLWGGAATPMSLATDNYTGAVVQVQQGSDASAWWRFDGSTWQRLAVRVATQTTIDLNNPGATIDGIAMNSGDRVLVKTQANTAQNGIYVWNGAASAMTRATDADAAAELAGAFTQVMAGTDAGRAFRQTALAPSGTLGSDPIQWAAVDAAPSYKIEVWILPDSATTANQIAAMQDTTRPMSFLSPGFTPQLRDTPKIPYPFRNVRLGFTIGQRLTATDQNFTISNSFITWIP
ncbi:MAG: hypothetical protein Q8L56_16845 [Rhodocyclaceae bacterium]|nr:hypothetical protein [Rhodocyclaceae bacterium]